MKIDFKAILFDLDGTLLDTLADLANSMNAALEELGLPIHPVEAYLKFVGDGVETEARRALGAAAEDPEIFSKCLVIAKQKYAEKYLENTAMYEGIAEMLDGLEGRGIGKAIFSNKPDEFVQPIVDKLLGKWSFAAVQGLDNNTPCKPDPTAAIAIAKKLGFEPEQIVYVGDTNTDMQTAVAAGMYAVGVLWGFRGAEELKANGAEVLIEKPGELLELFSA